MSWNAYISALQNLRREIENRIDEEIEETMRGRGDSLKFKASLEYTLNDSGVLNGRYKSDECIK